jgi:hypothetical protein
MQAAQPYAMRGICIYFYKQLCIVEKVDHFTATKHGYIDLDKRLNSLRLWRVGTLGVADGEVAES